MFPSIKGLRADQDVAMRWFRANGAEVPFETPLDSERESTGLSASDVRIGKLAVAMMLILLLTLTIFSEWRGANTVRSRIGSRREALQQSLEMLGEQYIVEGEYLEAIIVFETLLEAYPGSAPAPDALCRVGLCWLCLDNTDMAIDAWERFLKLYPKSEHAPKVRQGYLMIMKNRLNGIPA
jgi:outer membrane protein assembly factor BamD (BamD/ComL family)